MVDSSEGQYLVALERVSPGHDYQFPVLMDLSPVDRTGYPTAAWKYLVKSVTLGRSYALYAANVACLELLGIVGRFDSPSCRAISQSLDPMASRLTVSTAVPFLLCMMTASLTKVTVQSASHRGPKHIKLWQKLGIRCPFIVNPYERWGKARLPIPADFLGLPHCYTHCDLWCRTVYVGHRAICGKLSVGGARVYNACGVCC